MLHTLRSVEILRSVVAILPGGFLPCALMYKRHALPVHVVRRCLYMLCAMNTDQVIKRPIVHDNCNSHLLKQNDHSSANVL